MARTGLSSTSPRSASWTRPDIGQLAWLAAAQRWRAYRRTRRQCPADRAQCPAADGFQRADGGARVRGAAAASPMWPTRAGSDHASAGRDRGHQDRPGQGGRHPLDRDGRDDDPAQPLARLDRRTRAGPPAGQRLQRRTAAAGSHRGPGRRPVPRAVRPAGSRRSPSWRGCRTTSCSRCCTPMLGGSTRCSTRCRSRRGTATAAR